MALFLTPIPTAVIDELEKRSKLLGNSAEASRVDLSKMQSDKGLQWAYGRTPFVRAASFAVVRDSYTQEFVTAYNDAINNKLVTAREEVPDGVQSDPNKHYHRLKNVLYGGMQNQNNSIPTEMQDGWTNMMDDFSFYNTGYDGHLQDKLTGYKTSAYNDENSRTGVPMPGIKSVTVENVGTLGSLKKIDLEIECHDFAQLQMIESLYMSPGITVLLEWGWSVNTAGSDITSTLIDLSQGDKLKNVTNLHQELLEKAKANKFSYEGAIATITNYNWSAKENGSFSCNVSLRSRGEAMLGTQVQSAHAPLLESIKKLSAPDGSTNEAFYQIKNKKTSTRDKRGESFDAHGNKAQEYLKNNLGTTANNYYPSFHAALGDSINGKAIPGYTDTISGDNVHNENKPFPRFYYTYKASQATDERRALKDRAQNSMIQGDKKASIVAQQANNIIQDTIANYVATVVFPAIKKNSYGSGKKGNPAPDYVTGVMGKARVEPNGLKSIAGNGSYMDAGKYIGQPMSYNGFGTATESQKFAMVVKNYRDNNSSSGGHAPKPMSFGDRGVSSGGSPGFDMLYRPTVGNYSLLFGAYHPFGKGVGEDKNWAQSLDDPVTNNFKYMNENNLMDAFYNHYATVYIPVGATDPTYTYHGNAFTGGNGVSPDDYINPMMSVVSKEYIITKGSKGMGHQKYTVPDTMPKFLSAGNPLSAFGYAMRIACKRHPQGESILGFGKGLEEFHAFIKENNNNKIPGASDIVKAMSGTSKGPHYFTKYKPGAGSTAISVWAGLDAVVGKGGNDGDKSFGFPHKFTAGDVSRHFGVIHLALDNEVALRQHSGIDAGKLGSGTGAQNPLAPSSGGPYGIYGGYKENNSGIGSGNQIRTLKSTILKSSTPRVVDYPMPMWGHYQKLDSSGNFAFVQTIADNKASFKGQLQQSKQSGALAKGIAFSDAYKIYEEFRKITDGDVFIPFSVLEQIVNDNISLQSPEGVKYTRFDSGDHLLAGPPNRIPEASDSAGKKLSAEAFQTLVNEYNDSETRLTIEEGAPLPDSSAVGIQPIDIEGREKELVDETVQASGESKEEAASGVEQYGHHFGFKNSSQNLAAYFYSTAPEEPDTPFPSEMYQLVSLPTKICNHQYLASTDPRICILPGQTGVSQVVSFDDQTQNQVEFISDAAGNEKLEGLQSFKLFTDQDKTERTYGFLPHILINTNFINKCFKNATTIKDAMQKVLDGMSQSCGNIWNFKFQIDGEGDSGTTKIIDANYANSHVDVVAQFPVQRMNSIVTGYSLQSKIPNAMAVMALYGNNTAFDDGTVPNKLYELGNMFVDLAHENIQVPISNAEPTADDNTFIIPKDVKGRVQGLVHLLTYHIHDNLTEEHVSNAGRLLETILNDKANANVGDNALLDHNIVPVKMSFELDGISGIHYGHALLSTHLPARYKDTVCFQVTNVKHSITTSGWKTTVESIMRRRPIDMSVYKIGSGGGRFDPNQLDKKSPSELSFTRDPISWKKEGVDLPENKTYANNTTDTEGIGGES